LNQRLQEIAFPGSNPAQALLPMETDQEEYCGKWKVLNGLLKQWQDENSELERIDESGDQKTSAKRNKVLIFTKSRKLLDVIGATLDYEGTMLALSVFHSHGYVGYETCQLHGSMKPDEREHSIV
jgi:superfamily II DNA/RNA helicase